MSLSMDLDQGDRFWVLTVAGELDYGECPAFRVQIDRVLRAAPAAAIVDVSGLEYLDSSGLGLLLSLSREFASTGGRLVLVTNDTVDNVLEMTRLAGIFSTAPDIDQAKELLADTGHRA